MKREVSAKGIRKLSCWSVLLWSAVCSTRGTALELRNFRQLEGQFSNATGVATSNYSVRLIANQVLSSLPERSDLTGFNGTYVKAASALGAIYCQEMVNKESRTAAASRRFHGQVDFALLPQNQSDAIVGSVISALASAFWGRAASQGELEILMTSATSLRNSVPAQPRGTKRLYTALCSVIATSLETLVNQN